MEKKLPGKNIPRTVTPCLEQYTSRGFPFFRKFWKMLFHSLLEVAEN